MNILFFDKDLGPGGIAVVTESLAKAFHERGHNTSVFVLSLPDDKLVSRLPKDVPLTVGHGIKVSSENVDQLHQLLVDRKIDVVINQQGLNPVPITVLTKAHEGLNVKVISVYHNQVNSNGRIVTVQQQIRACHNPLLLPLLRLKLRLFTWVTARSMRNVYNKSDVFEVLSPSFVPLFSEFTGIEHPDKLRVQTNPVTVPLPSEPIAPETQEKEIIFVGRLDNMHKCPYRIIDTWKLLEAKYPDWRVTLVGDGPDRAGLEALAKQYGLQRLTFAGFQNPLPYYQRASILMLTSDIEGFPLVLAECMSYGVIPVVYASYPAVYDIVKDQENGIIIPYNKRGYPTEDAAQRLANLLDDEALRTQMSQNAVKESKKYSVDSICEQWEETFKALTDGTDNTDSAC